MPDFGPDLVEVFGPSQRDGGPELIQLLTPEGERREHPDFTFTAPDGLHHNDWSYACWAKLLTAGITHAVTKPTLSAHVGPATR